MSKDDYGLTIRRMPSSTIIKNFVSGIDYANYETYLRELLNYSSYFVNLGRSFYRKPNSEENGQCDAVSDNYEIDFKLLASQTELMAASILYEQPIVVAGGITYFTNSKQPGGYVKATRIHAALRELTLDNLYAIRQRKTKFTNTDNDICEVLDTMETRKNILLFFPYILSFSKQVKQHKAINIIEKSVSNDFRHMFQYRKKCAPDLILSLPWYTKMIFLFSKATH